MVLSETGAKQGHVILFVCPFFRSPCKFGNKKKDLYRGKKILCGVCTVSLMRSAGNMRGKTTQYLNLGIFLLSRI